MIAKDFILMLAEEICIDKDAKEQFKKAVEEFHSKSKFKDAHLRLSSGTPQSAVLKEGYYDGCYSFIDEKGNYVITEKGFKIDIYSIEDVEDFVYDEEGNDSKVIIDLHDQNSVQSIQNRIKDASKKYKEVVAKLDNAALVDVLKKINEGWKIVQPRYEKIGMYNVMRYVKDIIKFVDDTKIVTIDNDNQSRLCQGECGAVLKFGFFKSVCLDNLIEWKFLGGKNG